ncbi:MAG: hypothetical protein ONB05_00145, partial [candidate division KSB1 bacterium]|nr:hypothetical protein [candidate division KSB1 bacterium]
ISERAVKSGLPKPKNFMEEVHFEAKVLNYSDAKNDPFRAIKISDALLDPDATLIAEVKNVRKNRRGHLEAISIQMFSEVTHSKISGKELTFTTKLWIDNDLQHKKGVSQTITIDEIIQANQAFYLDKMKLDDAFYQQSEVQPCSSQLLRESFDNNSFPLRIGRFSGVWSVTLDKYRNPQPPRGRGYGHSKNVADGKFPMGWIKVTVTPASQRQ